MQHLEVSGAVRPVYGSLGVKGLMSEGSTEQSRGFWGRDSLSFRRVAPRSRSTVQ